MDTVASPTFATLLRHYRLAAGLTQEELAERANLSARGVSDLERGLRTSPRPETVELLARAIDLPAEDRVALEGAVSRRRGPAAHPIRQLLPAEPTSLIGRQHDEARALELLHGGVRLLTLTGSGGVGKTRLALRVARRLEGELTGGAVFVSLAPIRDPLLVPVTLATAVGLRPQAGLPLEDQLAAHLSNEERLLVLDNFEHLLDAGALVSQLVALCARLTVIVTSRCPLHLQAEWEMEVRPLAAPPSTPSPGEALRFPAVALFLERARAAKADFQSTQDGLSAIAEICRALDGLPLAIELAAAQVKVLPPEALLTRLDRRLPLLTGGPRDLPYRQQTMYDTIAWSYNLLTPAEQTLFQRLAVFAGGCTVEAANAVCERAGHLEVTPLAGLASLVDKSLLAALGVGDVDGTPRFSMLETVREFALAQLLAGSDAEAAHREHASYYLSLAENAEREISGPAQEALLNRLETEHQNFRAALRLAKRAGDVELGLRLAAALAPFWMARGHLEEAQTWLDTFLASAESIEIPDAVRARALYAGASVFGLLSGHNERSLSTLHEVLKLAQRAGDDATAAVALWQLGMDHSATADFRRGEELLKESLTLFQRLGDQSGICAVLMGLAMPPRFRGDFERAATIYGEALSAAREIGHSRRVAEILARLGSLESERGRPERSARLYEEALVLYRRLGDSFGIADSLLRSGETAVDLGRFQDGLNLLETSLPIFESHGSTIAVAHVRLYQGKAALRMGDLGRAEELASQSLEVFMGFDDNRFVSDARLVLADVAREQHNLERAVTLYKASLSDLRRQNARPLMAQCLDRMLVVAALQELAERAARLHGAVQALRADMGAAMPPADREGYKHTLAIVRERMGKEAFEAAVGEGEAMTLDQAVDYALDGVTAGRD